MPNLNGPPASIRPKQPLTAIHQDRRVLARILCIEDNLAIREMLRFALVNIGRFELCNCADGDEALARFPDHRPELILLDWQLPERSGTDTLKAMRALSTDHPVPVVIMSSRNDQAGSSAITSSGAIGTLAKPLDPMRLASQLRKFYANHSRSMLN